MWPTEPRDALVHELEAMAGYGARSPRHSAISSPRTPSTPSATERLDRQLERTERPERLDMQMERAERMGSVDWTSLSGSMDLRTEPRTEPRSESLRIEDASAAQSTALVTTRTSRIVPLNDHESWVVARDPANLALIQASVSSVEAKVDQLLAANAALADANEGLKVDNEHLKRDNEELLSSLRAISQTLNDVMRDNRLIVMGIRNSEHTAREQRLILRDLYDRVEAMEVFGGKGGLPPPPM